MLLAGTSGWSHPQWKGGFYPAGSRSGDWLSLYAQRLPAVELNSSFYRLPAPASITRWIERTPPEFLFALKAWKAITHEARLRDAEARLQEFLTATEGFGPKRGPLLFQLPPSLARDEGLLAAFLEHLPADRLPVFEFRHPSWQQETVYRLLADHGAALCLAHIDGWTTPRLLTAPFAYLRLHGTAGWFKGAYDAAFLDELRTWLADSGAAQAYIFFNNTLDPAAPYNAEALLQAAFSPSNG